MNLLDRLRQWRQSRGALDDSAWDSDTPAWLASLLVHLAILTMMALVGTVVQKRAEIMTLLAGPDVQEDPLSSADEFRYSANPPDAAIGATGEGRPDAMLSAAPSLAMTAAMPSQLDAPQGLPGSEPIRIQDDIRIASAPRLADNLSIRGAPGVGATGAGGAVDRITQEILKYLEKQRTLVVWLFDQSGSLANQRVEINKRFDRIYEELGVVEASGNPAFSRHEDKPLLSAVMAFGEKISFLTPKPTDDLQAIKSAVAGMKTDDSGIERTFEAVVEAADHYRAFRSGPGRRKVIFIVFTDEIGNDERDVDRAVATCRRSEIPVYCVGVPAPFGRRHSLMKYVDPDPKFDQTPQWVKVEQGPESFLPELVQINEQFEDPMDSGFGPYALSRLCVETGGIFFAVHPNRDERRAVNRRDTSVLASYLSNFFNEDVMQAYRPEYVSVKEYNRFVEENKARKALVTAAQLSTLTPLDRPPLRFPKRDDADLVKRATEAQHAAALIEPTLDKLYETLKVGEKDRPRLTQPRWQAGYDLSMGRVLAVLVRTKTYHAMLAKLKNGMRFQDAKDDTWQLTPSDEVSVGSTLEKQAKDAKMYLERVVRDHPQTPWAVLAEKELKEPLGFTWKESYTGVNAPRPAVANNNKNRPPQNDKAKMIPKPVRRDPPKL